MEDLKYALTTAINHVVRNATAVVFVSISERGISAKTVEVKAYLVMVDRNYFVKIVEVHKYVNTTDRSLIVELVTQLNR